MEADKILSYKVAGKIHTFKLLIEIDIWEADNSHHQEDGNLINHKAHPEIFLALEEWVNRLADSVNS